MATLKSMLGRREHHQGVDKTKKMMLKSSLKKIAPKQGYHFHSDYFQIDGEFARILTLFPKTGAAQKLPPFWTAFLIPSNLAEGVTARLFQSITTMPQKWVEKKQLTSEGTVKSEYDTARRSKNNKHINQFNTRRNDYEVISKDLQEGDKYLATDYKILIKGPTLESLDRATVALNRMLDGIDFLGGMKAHVYEGRQRYDFSHLFARATEQLGRPKMFTSEELAGGYNLLTHGISDTLGEYMGQTVGDINGSTVVFDCDNFDDHVVVASKFPAVTLTRQQKSFGTHVRASTLWGMKLAQTALINEHRVIHLILNGAEPQKLGIDLSNLTTVVSMNQGAINPFELFGKVEDELSVFPIHSQKLRVMAKQISPSLTDVDLNKNLTQVIQQFYVDKRMWVPNAKYNRSKLRLVGLPHSQYPTLQEFVSYLRVAREAAARHRDTITLQSVERLQSVFGRMLDENADLFNVKTDSTVDDVVHTPQVIYDFSSIQRRSSGLAMAQFVNALGYATSRLENRDLVIIHGAENISKGARNYVSGVIDDLYKRGVRVAFLYDDISKCIIDAKFNGLASANWTLFSAMTKPELNDYCKTLDKHLPKALASKLTNGDERQKHLWYLSRGIDNVLFYLDMIFGDEPQKFGIQYKKRKRRLRSAGVRTMVG